MHLPEFLMKKTRVAIIGTGNISRTHIKAYQKLENVEIVAACDINRKRVEDFCRDNSIPGVYHDHNELLEKEKPDAISICTWNNSHARIAIDALRAGSHVLCEKPLAMNRHEAEEMKKTAEETGKLLMVGFVRRFDQGTEIARDFINSGRLGDVYYAKTGCIRRCGNPTGWFADKSKSGGGPLIDLGVHMIDLCRYLMGKPETAGVYGVTFENIGPRADIKMLRRYRPADVGTVCDVEDFASALIRFRNGAALSVEVSFTLHTANEKLYCEIFGTKAGIEIAPEVRISGSEEGYNTDLTPVFSKDTNNFQAMFDRQIEHFIDCTEGKAECISPVEDGVELMKILDAVYESARTGREIRFE